MAWKVFLDVAVYRGSEQLDQRSRSQLLLIKRRLERDGPAVLGLAERPGSERGMRYGSVEVGLDIWMVSVEFWPESAMIIRGAWSFRRPDWF